MLLLFDIDGTLLRTEGAGLAALNDAAAALFGPHVHCDGIPAAGRLDPLIMADMLVRAGIAPTRETMATVRAEYARRLPARLASPAFTVRAMPGVDALLARLRGEAPRAGAVTGLLTGNYEETGRMKLQACGIDPGQFQLNVWGDESPSDPPTRNDLPGVGLRRFEARHGRRLEAERMVIIGDTPHDVACAKAHGGRALAVATGKYGVDELRNAGADEALETLEETDRVLAWLLGG